MATKLIFLIAMMASLTHTKPIMVSFGTNKGPIEPAAPSSTTKNPLAPRSSAPVVESREDREQAPRYQPLTPHQYRNDLYSRRPNPNLILGTPIDVKYTPAIEKSDYLSDRKAKYAGRSYTGPHLFEVQEYEIERARRKLQRQQQYRSATTQKRHDVTGGAYQFGQPQRQSSYVPQIGIVYSSGVRYYIPQIYYYDDYERENSVYDANDLKYGHHQRQKEERY